MRTMVRMAFAAAMLFGATAAQAWHIEGYVACDANADGILSVGDTPLVGVVVRVSGSGSFTASGTTDANGFYHIPMPDVAGDYTAELDPTSLPSDGIVLVPGPGPFAFSLSDSKGTATRHWLVDSASCAAQQGTCWMTGGGAKFSSITNIGMAEKGPQHSFGGNVNPSCSPYPGQGGQWNHVAHSAKLHFLGSVIRVVRCGNVADEIPPGSTSPVTPYNFIEYEGTGTLKGIQGNKADHGIVSFFARAEDRNEPGSNGAKAGAQIDRYYIHVFSNAADPAGSTLLLVDGDGSAPTVDPVTITGGNLQLHISSCTPQ